MLAASRWWEALLGYSLTLLSSLQAVEEVTNSEQAVTDLVRDFMYVLEGKNVLVPCLVLVILVKHKS